MKLKSFISLLLISFLTTANAQYFSYNADSSKVKLSGTDFYFRLPDGFVVSPVFSGIIHKATGSSVLITQVDNISYLMYIDYFNDNYFLENNLILVRQDTIDLPTERAYVFEATFMLQEQEFTRYYIITGNMNSTVLLILNASDAVAERIYQEFVPVLSSISFDKKY